MNIQKLIDLAVIFSPPQQKQEYREVLELSLEDPLAAFCCSLGATDDLMQIVPPGDGIRTGIPIGFALGLKAAILAHKRPDQFEKVELPDPRPHREP